MDNNDVVKLYEKEIEIFLGNMGIFKGAKICNTDPDKNKANREFIIKKMIQIKSGNIDRIALETAVDNLLPFLCKK